MFVLLQRYTFWSNSQLIPSFSLIVISCLYYCKDTLFEAIHNRLSTLQSLRPLFVLLQRYTFWSNSQRLSTADSFRGCCLYYCKDTLFEAIHNYTQTRLLDVLVVCITAKIHFLKQFTTCYRKSAVTPLLFVLLQRYTFWSNSQPADAKNVGQNRCLYYCKDTLFEAIHNKRWLLLFNCLLFVLLQRYTFWSNSQQFI